MQIASCKFRLSQSVYRNSSWIHPSISTVELLLVFVVCFDGDARMMIYNSNLYEQFVNWSRKQTSIKESNIPALKNPNNSNTNGVTTYNNSLRLFAKVYKRFSRRFIDSESIFMVDEMQCWWLFVEGVSMRSCGCSRGWRWCISALWACADRRRRMNEQVHRSNNHPTSLFKRSRSALCPLIQDPNRCICGWLLAAVTK